MHKNEIRQMLELSAAAYRENQSVCEYSMVTYIQNEKTDTECYVRRKGNDIIIAFRGTDSNINWFLNFCFAKKVIPYGNSKSEIRVHEGFLEEYMSVRKAIRSFIPDGTCRIRVTGHSLGAALAVLCAVDIQYNFPDKDVEAILFGCPRVGNAAFSKSYDKRVFKTLRVSNGNDIVTKVPPSFFGYRHVGTDIQIGKIRLPFVFSLEEHRTKNYYKNLWHF